MSYKGRFRPHNPEKYKGNPTTIIYRSLWELKFMRYLDADKRVLEWSSEEFFIPYKDPSSNRVRRYFPDFKARTNEKTVIFEIKPYKQTLQPLKENYKTENKFIKDILTYATNNAKWKAAVAYCDERKWEFKVMTEYQLGLPQYK